MAYFRYGQKALFYKGLSGLYRFIKNNNTDSLREFLSQSREEELGRKLIKDMTGKKLDFWEQM
jgi:hypothetical protein